MVFVVRISFDLMCPHAVLLTVQVPFSLEDPDYKGLELDLMAFCEKHGKPSRRLVAFEGTMTGRRFLSCAEPVFFLPW